MRLPGDTDSKRREIWRSSFWMWSGRQRLSAISQRRDDAHRRRQSKPLLDNGSRVVVPFLKAHNTRGVDVVVSSHPHSDHIGGLVAVLEQMPVRHFVDSGQECDTWTARRLRQLIREKGIQYHRVAAGDSLAGLGGVEALVPSPHGGVRRRRGRITARPEQRIGGYAVQVRKHEPHVHGDAEVETDEPILRWGGRLDIDILKVAHHGSPTSSRPRFIEALSPTTSVVSVGEVNSFGHPSQACWTDCKRGAARCIAPISVAPRSLESAGSNRVADNDRRLRQAMTQARQ